MKKILFIIGCLLLLHNYLALAQVRCGVDELKATLIAHNPAFEQQFEARKKQLQAIAQNYEAAQKLSSTTSTTTNITIPVVFHIIVNESQYQQMGGKWGIEQRCNTQIEVLNEDFNRQNSDSNLIPTLWKPLYANVGIHFGLAHTDPLGYPSPGYTVRIISDIGFFGFGDSYDSAKNTNLGGTDAWDVTKCINVWCGNFINNTNNNLLGLTVAHSFTGNGALPTNDIGICIAYNTLGKRNLATDNYPTNYDLGRTLTHEMGHLFEIWHVWGDDGGSCPWTGGRSVLPDVPPQGNNTYNNPVYTIPGGTINDNCKDSSGVNMQPKGIACLDYMDYTDDLGMHIFTLDQAAVMNAQIADTSAESYSLTQHPEMLNYPPGAPQVLNVLPNPTDSKVIVAFDNTNISILQISVYNILGARVQQFTPTTQNSSCIIDLSTNREGMYIIQCQSTNGIFVEKVMLQAISY